MSGQSSVVEKENPVAEKVRQFCEAFPEQRPISTAPGKLRPTQEQGLTETDRGQIQAITDLAKQLRQDITQIARSTKPMAVKQRMDYCTSALGQLRDRVAELDEGRAKTSKMQFTRQIESMTQEVADARDAGVQRAFAGLGQVRSAALKAVADYGRQIDNGGDKAAIYPKLGETLSGLRREQIDWSAQVRDASGWLKSDAKPLQVLLARLDEACVELDTLSAKCLPTLTTKLPPKGTGSAKQEAVRAPQPIQEGTEEATIVGLCKGSWVEAKQKFGAFKTDMQMLADFRKKEVDAWLTDTLTPWGLKKGPDTGWVSVGSSDPTSDYDISINKHGQKTKDSQTTTYFDYQIVRDFNDHFRKKYKVESGTVFDTNLYAAAPASVPKLGGDSEAEKAALAQVTAANDVGALMKLRRYMSAGDFEDYRSRTLAAAAGNQPQLTKLQSQFKMADASYMISLSQTLEKMEALLDKKLKAGETLSEDLQHAKEIVDEWRGNAEKYSGLAIAEGEDAMEKLARKLEHCKDANTLATNELYTDSIAGVRGQEARVNTFNGNAEAIRSLLRNAKPPTDPGAVPAFLQDLAKQLTALGAGSAITRPLAAGDMDAALAGVDTQSAELLSDLAQQKALSMFFANEAYQSGGPFQHVVYAGQAVETDLKAKHAETTLGKEALANMDADTREKAIDEEWKKRDPTLCTQEVKEERDRRRAGLPAAECLDSFNEQLGDFLKDLAHYGEAEPGVAIVQSSKYLERLIDAVRLMNDKQLFEADTGLKGELLGQIAIQQRLMDELIAARKGNLSLVPGDDAPTGVPVDQVAQRRAYACDFMQQRGITSLAGLSKTYVDLGIRINTVARRALAGTT